MTKDLGFYERSGLIGRATFALVQRYQADAADEPHPSAEGRTKEYVASEAILFSSLALWLAQPSCVNFRLVLHAHRMGGEWCLAAAQAVPPILPGNRYCQVEPTRQDLEVAQQLNVRIWDLPRSGAVWTAIRTLLAALESEHWEIRYLLLWVLLEALFGPEDAREMTFRLSQRMALFLESEGSSAREIYRQARDGYGWRSKIVHGMRLRSLTSARASEIMEAAEDLVRASMRKVVSSPELSSKFSGRGRERYLDDLVFSRPERAE